MGINKFAKYFSLGVGALLGVDIATDVIIDEEQDFPVITHQATPAQQGDAKKNNHGFLAAVKGIGMVAVFAFAAAVGPFSADSKKAPDKPTHSQSGRISEPSTAQPKSYATRINILRVFESGRQRSDLVQSLDLMQEPLRELLMKNIPEEYHEIFELKSMKFSIDGDDLVVAVDVAIAPNSTSEIRNAVAFTVQDHARKLFEEKLKAFSNELSQTPCEITQVVKNVVQRQLLEKRSRG